MGIKRSILISTLAISILSQTSCSSFSTPTSRAILNKNANVEIAEDYSSVHRESKTREPSNMPASDGQPILQSPTSFEWPVDRARFVRGFMPEKRRPHLGIDLASQRGTPIYSAQTGTVIYRGRDFRGFGKMVLVESGYGWATLYAHLDKFYVEEGQRVAQGEVIGAMGATGRATGVHLHFEIRKDRGPVDPLQYLPGGKRISRL